MIAPNPSGSLPKYSRRYEAWLYENRAKLERDYKTLTGRDKFPSLKYLYDPNEGIREFKLRGLDFGNWVPVSERITKSAALLVGLEQMAEILNWPNSKIGFNESLSLSIGGWGRGKALAFYVGDFAIINLTRLKGAATLAHEYFHAFDHYLDKILGHNGRGLYSDNSIHLDIEDAQSKGYVIANLLDKILDIAKYTPEGEPTKMIEWCNQQLGSGYWKSDIEILARCFEMYISRKKEKVGLVNNYLSRSTKEYIFMGPYPTLKEMDQMAPLFDQLAEECSKAMDHYDGTRLLHKPFEGGRAAKSNLVRDISVKNIYADPKIFQNRKTDFSQESVDRLMKAYEAGEFDFAKMDPITVYELPKGSIEFVVLSGHSRLKFFQKVSKRDRDFEKIPAKVFEGTLKEAVDFALNSNTLATKETESERANYYRKLRKDGEDAKNVAQMATNQEGRNASRILAYSYLNPKGNAFEDLQRFENADDTSRNNLMNIILWVGKLRMRFKVLTNAHENEIYNWLVEEGYGTQSNQYSNYQKLEQRIYQVIMKNSEFGEFKKDQPLNLKRAVSYSPIEKEHYEKIEKAKRALKDAQSLRDQKRKEFVSRGASNDEVISALKPYEDAVVMAQRELLELNRRTAQVLEADKNQGTLFGLRIKE